MAGLQMWAQAELRRQNVKDLHATYAATDALVDYRNKEADSTSSSSKAKKGKGKNGAEFETDKVSDGGKEKKKQNDETTAVAKKHSCFVCDGPHRARDCPRKEKLNALIVAENRENAEDRVGVANLDMGRGAVEVRTLEEDEGVTEVSTGPKRTVGRPRYLADYV